ncbi:HNH endonuclease [Sporosarcina psychrophila]|uniref:HNH endonuclease n=1 Tax=Sporosarcina psychrophila TaxID=1476 RepID=UPI00078BFC48|nr:hypothetical protein [Sporosarcina psychrophila]AMQ05217.1 hypothetical protein AZE41_04280 [Sporosarcina psychrophila]
MNDLEVSDSLIEDKKQEILGFIERNYPVTSVSGPANTNQTRHVISDIYEGVYKMHHGKGAKKNGRVNWKDDPKVWINIHTTHRKNGSKGLMLQIKCESFLLRSGRNDDKKKFATKWGIPVDNSNIEYSVWQGKILSLSIMNKEIFTFNPIYESYFTSFLVEAFKVYESNNLSNKLEYEKISLDNNAQKQDNPESKLPKNHTTLEVLPSPIDDYNEDVYVQSEIEDSMYQKEIQESSGFSKKVIVNDKSEPKPLKGSKGAIKTYIRNAQKGKNAIIMANHLCEIDSSHQDFTSKVTGMNYVEAHHLIPMEYQDSFNFSIDVEANIVSLCVSCHKNLHHSTLEGKLPILNLLYSERKKRIDTCKISVNEDVLISFYK